MRILKTSLVPAFIIARFSTDVAFNLRMTTLNRLIEPLRLVLAVRAMMECQPYKSSGPSAAYLYDAMARGNGACCCCFGRASPHHDTRLTLT